MVSTLGGDPVKYGGGLKSVLQYDIAYFLISRGVLTSNKLFWEGKPRKSPDPPILLTNIILSVTGIIVDSSI